MSVPPGPDFLPVGMQWRGQTEVEPGYPSPDLASVFSVLQFGKEVKDCSETRGLISNTFHSLSNYGVCLKEVEGVLLKNQHSVASRELRT